MAVKPFIMDNKIVVGVGNNLCIGSPISQRELDLTEPLGLSLKSDT